MQERRRPRAGCAAVSLALLVCASSGLLSCDDDPGSPCPVYEVGAVEGHVLGGGQGAQLTVGARADEGPQRGEVVARVQSDSTGWYRLELPSGIYRIQANPERGSMWSSDRSDTIHVSRGVRRRDLRAGRLEVDVAMPAPLEGRTIAVSVVSWKRDRHSASAEVRDGRLRVVMPFIPAGPHTVALGDIPGWFWPGTFAREAAESIAVVLDHPTTLTWSLDGCASVRGNIEGSWQAAYLYPGEVFAFSTDSVLVGSTRMAEDGSYMLDLFQAQPVRLAVEIDYVLQWIGGPDFDQATTFDPRPGEALAGVSLLESGIHCRVEGPGDFWAHRLEYILRDEAGREVRSRWGEYGDFSICNLRPGRYRLFLYGYCDEQPWAAQWYDGAATEAEATPIELGAGQLVDVAVHVVEGGSIAGVVRDAGGEPLDSDWVYLFNASGSQLCESGIYFFGGAFRVTGLADGDYRLAVREGDGYWWYPGTAYPESAGAITVLDHAAVSGIEWSLP